MTLFNNRRSCNRHRQNGRKNYPHIRYSTVHPPSQFWHSGPRIKLEGDWLVQAGFFPNWRVKITVHESRLIIEPLIKPIGALGIIPARPRPLVANWVTMSA